MPTPANTGTAQAAPQQPAPENTGLTITPTNTGTNTTNTATNTATDNTTAGYFKNLYERQTAGTTTIDKTGTAGVFKSTSGWQDKKYYCFSNDAAAGTILKITDNATGKSVYAKVLDAVPDISQNDGLVAVISNAAADELGAGENKFDCSLTFARQ